MLDVPSEPGGLLIPMQMCSRLHWRCYLFPLRAEPFLPRRLRELHGALPQRDVLAARFAYGLAVRLSGQCLLQRVELHVRCRLLQGAERVGATWWLAMRHLPQSQQLCERHDVAVRRGHLRLIDWPVRVRRLWPGHVLPSPCRQRVSELCAWGLWAFGRSQPVPNVRSGHLFQQHRPQRLRGVRTRTVQRLQRQHRVRPVRDWDLRQRHGPDTLPGLRRQHLRVCDRLRGVCVVSGQLVRAAVLEHLARVYVWV